MNSNPPPDRIRELCAQALRAESPELEQIMKELRDALHQHAIFLRRMSTEILNHLPSERITAAEPGETTATLSKEPQAQGKTAGTKPSKARVR